MLKALEQERKAGEGKVVQLRWPSIQLVLFCAYLIIASIMAVNISGYVNLWERPPQATSAVISKPRTFNYTLQWQNQPGIPFTIRNLSSFQFINIDFFLTATRNVTEKEPVEMSGYGTMSKSLVNSSFATLGAYYDTAVGYPLVGTSSTVYGLLFNLVPNGTVPMEYAFGPTVSVSARPINITWNFAGGRVLSNALPALLERKRIQSNIP